MTRQHADSPAFKLFDPEHAAHLRNLFNIYCNSAVKLSYTELLPRNSFARLIKDAAVRPLLLLFWRMR